MGSGDSEKKAIPLYGGPETTHGPWDTTAPLFPIFFFISGSDFWHALTSASRLCAPGHGPPTTTRDCLLVGRHDFLFFPLLFHNSRFTGLPPMLPCLCFSVFSCLLCGFHVLACAPTPIALIFFITSLCSFGSTCR